MTHRFPALGAAALLVLGGVPGAAENWPCWRGPRLDGSSRETNLPLHWGGSSNLVWRTPLPGSGHASPIVWSNHVFTVVAEPATEARSVLALEADSGRLLWQRPVLTSPLERKHALNSYASSTPATDGDQVYVAFLDVREMVVAAYDFQGHQRWSVRPGAFASMHGFCSSPVLLDNLVLVNGDHDGDGYLVALDRRTGATVWKTDRPNNTRSYCTPLIAPIAGRTQMVLSGSKCVASYNPLDGQLLWLIDGPTEQFVASPVYSPKTGLVYITGGFPDHHILALDPSLPEPASGDRIRWRTNRGVAYVPSPIIEGDYFLVVSDSGVAHCFKADSGDLCWQERLGEHHAALVSVAGNVYFLSDEGVLTVVQPGPEFHRLARNEVGERTFASPAISQGRIFLRGEQHLFAFGHP